MPLMRSIWTIAMLTTTTVAVSIAYRMMELIAGVSVVDVTALGVTAFLAGLFLGFVLNQTAASSGASPDSK